MNVSEIKSVIFELITEKVFGVKLHIYIGNKNYPALISKNTRHGEKEYRLTWFNKATPIRSIEPIDHIAFSEKELNYIISNKKLPTELVKWHVQHELPIPRLIFEHTVKNNDILVGNINDDGEIVARHGAAHSNLPGRWKIEGDWRYNPLTERVYWRESHNNKDEMFVEEWLHSKDFKVRQHITLSNISDTHAYEDMWDEAHGVYDDIVKK